MGFMAQAIEFQLSGDQAMMVGIHLCHGDHYPMLQSQTHTKSATLAALFQLNCFIASRNSLVASIRSSNCLIGGMAMVGVTVQLVGSGLWTLAGSRAFKVVKVARRGRKS